MKGVQEKVVMFTLLTMIRCEVEGREREIPRGKAEKVWVNDIVGISVRKYDKKEQDRGAAR
jgi:hypothetical protein